MISESTLSATYGIAERLSSDKKYVEVVPNTVLHDLINANVSVNTWAKVESPDQVWSISDIIDDSKRQDDEGNYPHDEAVEEAACTVADIVKGNHIVAKNEVIPKTLEVHELYSRLMEDRVTNIQTPALIMPNVYHDVWSNDHLSGLVKRFKGIAFKDYATPKSFPSLDEPTLREMLNTGLSSLDEDIESWYQQLPDEKLQSTYRAVFIEKHPIGRTVNSQHVVPNTPFNREDLLIAHLISLNFEDKLPDNVNIGLDELREILVNIRSATGHAINRVFDQRSRDIRTKQLAFKLDRYDWEFNTGDGKRRVIHVNNDVYLDYLKNGGSPEAVLGSAMLDSLESYDSIMDNKESFEKQWNRRLAYHKQELGAHLYRAQRECVLLAMTRWINEQDQETLPVDRSIIHKQVEEGVSQLEPSAFEDDILVIRCLICDVLYSETDVKMFLSAMDTAELNDPDLEPRELALQATVDMVCRWMASQMELKDIPIEQQRAYIAGAT